MTRVISKQKGVTDAPRELITHYDVLGVSPGDSTETIHKAYLVQARAHAPRKLGDPEEIFKDMALSWGVLKNVELRAQYDARLRLEGKLNCARCKGFGRVSGFISGSYKKGVACPECKGKGHL